MTRPTDEISSKYFEMPKRLADSIKTATAARGKSGEICELDEVGEIPDAPFKKNMPGENLPPVGKLIGHKRHRTTAGYAHLADGLLVMATEKLGNIVAGAMVMSTIANPP